MDELLDFKVAEIDSAREQVFIPFKDQVTKWEAERARFTLSVQRVRAMSRYKRPKASV